MKAAAVIAAAGEGARMGGAGRKQYLLLEGIPMLARSVSLFLEHPAVKEIVVVVPRGEVETVKELLKPFCSSDRIKYAEGGATRQESVGRGVTLVSSAVGLICIHDAARPLASTKLLDSLLTAAASRGAAVPVIPLNDTVKKVDDKGFILSTQPRENLRLVQTPQVFRRDIIIKAYENADVRDLAATDDAALVEQMGLSVFTVPGEFSNLKITSPRDLSLASVLLKGTGE